MSVSNSISNIPYIIAGYVVGALTGAVALRLGGIVPLAVLSIVALITALIVKNPATVGNAFGVMSLLLFLSL